MSDLKQYRYIIRDRIGGKPIEYVNTKVVAQKLIKKWEKEDKSRGIYEPNSYEIYNQFEDRIED